MLDDDLRVALDVVVSENAVLAAVFVNEPQSSLKSFSVTTEPAARSRLAIS